MYYKTCSSLKPDKSIPQVPLHKFLIHSANILKNPLPFHHKNFVEKGDTFRLKIGFNKSVIFSRDAALAEYVLQKNQKNFTKSKIQTQDLAKYVGNGLLTAEGQHWKQQRKLIQPAFHKKNLVNLLNVILSAIKTEYRKIEVDRSMDVFPIFNDLAFQSVVKSLFSSAADSNEIKRLQYITEAAQRMLVKELRQPYLNWWFKRSGKIQKHLNLTNEARDILGRMVKDRENSDKPEGDLLDMLLGSQYADGSFMEKEQLIDEILILFTAGHETTSNALSFTSQLLALYPQWQEKIYQETKDIDENSSLMEFVMSAKFTQQVVEESLRLYPPAYFIDRVNLEPDEFESKDFEAGSNLLFSIHEIHRHPDLWDDPDSFKPERFENGGQQYSAHYFPFGAGPRKCIGNNFAMFEMILAIAELVKNYHLIPDFSEIEITPLITMKPRNARIVFSSRRC